MSAAFCPPLSAPSRGPKRIGSAGRNQNSFAPRMGMLRRRASAWPHAQNALARSHIQHSHLQLQRPDCSLRAAPRKLLPRVEALPAFGSYSGALVPHQADTSPHLTAQVSDSSPTPRERRNSSPTPRERRPSDPSPMQRRASLMSGSPFRRERRTSLTGSPTRRERRASNSSPSRRERRTSFSGDPFEEVTRMVSNPWTQCSRVLLAQCSTSTPCNRAHPACGRMKTRRTTRFPRRP